MALWLEIAEEIGVEEVTRARAEVIVTCKKKGKYQLRSQKVNSVNSKCIT